MNVPTLAAQEWRLYIYECDLDGRKCGKGQEQEEERENEGGCRDVDGMYHTHKRTHTNTFFYYFPFTLKLLDLIYIDLT